MKRQLPALTLIAAMAAAAVTGCSSDSGGTAETTGGTTAGSTAGNTDAGNTTGTTTGNQGDSSKGAWFGTSNFGDAVVIIDDSNTLYALSSSTTSNTHEAVTGTVGSALERFLHRDSDNTAFGDSFTLVGDIPSQRTPPLPDTVTYNLAVANDGQQLNNTGAAGDFSLTFAGTDDIGAITLADIEGSWRARTSYCVADCDLELNLTFGADGVLTSGNTLFNGGNQIDITGGASVAANSTQHLAVSFTWNSFNRTGVIYKDRNSSKIVLNTFGPDSDGNHSFTAKLTRQ